MRLFQASELQMGTPGAAFGALSGSDDIVFDMTLLDFAERLRTVQQIFQSIRRSRSRRAWVVGRGSRRSTVRCPVPVVSPSTIPGVHVSKMECARR